MLTSREKLEYSTFLPRSGSCESTSNIAGTYLSQPFHHLHLPGLFLKSPHRKQKTIKQHQLSHEDMPTLGGGRM